MSQTSLIPTSAAFNPGGNGVTPTPSGAMLGKPIHSWSDPLLNGATETGNGAGVSTTCNCASFLDPFPNQITWRYSVPNLNSHPYKRSTLVLQWPNLKQSLRTTIHRKFRPSPDRSLHIYVLRQQCFFSPVHCTFIQFFLARTIFKTLFVCLVHFVHLALAYVQCYRVVDW